MSVSCAGRPAEREAAVISVGERGCDEADDELFGPAPAVDEEALGFLKAQLSFN
jgi:hypothetical protein